MTYTALLSTLIQMNGTMICGRKLPFSMPTRVHTTHMTSLTRSMTDLFRLKKRLFSRNLPTQKLLTSKSKKFSANFSHKRALRLQKPRYFLLPRHSVATQQSTSSFMTVYLIFSTLSRQKAKRFIFSQTHSVHSQKMS